jgi:hypothetical protein
MPQQPPPLLPLPFPTTLATATTALTTTTANATTALAMALTIALAFALTLTLALSISTATATTTSLCHGLPCLFSSWLLHHLIVCIAALPSAAALLLSASLPVICIIACCLGCGDVIYIAVRHLRVAPLSAPLSIVCIDVCIVVCVNVCIVVCVVVCVVVVCVIVICAIDICVTGVGGRVCFVLYLCGGGRWCDIPMTWQMMTKTYSDKQCNPSK